MVEPSEVKSADSLATDLTETVWMPEGSACRRRSCVAHLVLETARAERDAIAVSVGSEQMSYGELTDRARRLASYLISVGVRPDVPVAICLERSFDLVSSALAILLAGGAYLPLDPAWPAARVKQILADADAPFVITHGRIADLTAKNGKRVIDLEAEAEFLSGFDPLAHPVDVTRENLAYVIYTSGSTGRPKGVEVTHGNLLNLIFWHRRFFEITPHDRASFLAGVAFDAAVWEIWPNLTAGATLVLPDASVRTSAELLRDWLVAERITMAFVPTVLAEPILSQRWPADTALRYLLTGGDTLHRAPSKSFPVPVVNNYGPTECTVVATSGTVMSGDANVMAPPIGKPIAHTKIYILDEERKPVGVGETGEIYIGGTGVARGYRNSEEETEKRFFPDPFSANPIGANSGARLYRTGDLGYFLPDGQIAFCGRADAQLEIHGHRIEPDEVALALNRHPSVMASAVVAHGECCSRRLVAYIVPRPEAVLSASDLRDFLSAQLPQYMVPANFCKVASLPLNFNGKLDRNALPNPTPDNIVRDAAYRRPNTTTEDQLSSILVGLLGVPQIGIDDNFFLLGLHSLLATQVAARVFERFGVQLTPRHLFEAKTVARLSAEVDRLLQRRLDAMSDEEINRLLAC